MNKKILVVDDEPGITEIIKSRFETNSYEIISALDGEEALRKVRSENPDLIILDIKLPGIDGYEVLRRLRQIPANKYTPVIMLTMKAETESLIKAHDLQSTDYIIKPFSVKELADLVKKYI